MFQKKNNIWVIIRSGVKGQKWYHRYHQSYSTKPTRSGKVGEEHFKENSKKTISDKLKAHLKGNNKKSKNEEYKVKDKTSYADIADKLDDVRSEMAELDMFSKSDQKNIKRDYIKYSFEANSKIRKDQTMPITDYKDNVLGRDKKLDIIFDTFSDEKKLSNNQKKTMDSLHNVDFSSKELDNKVKKYIKEDTGIKENNIDNPFKYINPKNILVLNDIINKNTGADLALMCNYKMDPEHGLAILFTKDGKVITIGPEDIAI